MSGELPPPAPPRNNNWGQGPGYQGPGSCADNMYTDDSYTRHTHHHRTHYTQEQSAEFMYRMHRMNYLYPRVMQPDDLVILNNALSTGTAEEFRVAASIRSVEVNRVVTDIETRNAAASSGSRGAASRSGSHGSSYGSFGGGRR